MIYDVSAAFCNEKGTLKSICPLITGDALLYSMFRETGNPMQCPFKPPYTFTYNRGHGDCKNPVSTVEACTQDSRLLIRYQACPDVEGSESARELTRQCSRAGEGHVFNADISKYFVLSYSVYFRLKALVKRIQQHRLLTAVALLNFVHIINTMLL